MPINSQVRPLNVTDQQNLLNHGSLQSLVYS